MIYTLCLLESYTLFINLADTYRYKLKVTLIKYEMTA